MEKELRTVKKTDTQSITEDKDPEPIDWDWVELIGTTKLGLNKKEVSHLLFREFVSKHRLYKAIVLEEKMGFVPQKPKETDSLRNL